MVLSLLFIPYMLMLRKESFFQLNRCVLLTIMFLSLTLPLMNLHFLSIEDQPVVQAARSQMIDIGIPLTEHAITLPEVSISASEKSTCCCGAVAINSNSLCASFSKELRRLFRVLYK